jgi:predicted lipoprotein with Yx(FWY)xxD motif
MGIAAALMAAGCGSSSSSATTTTASTPATATPARATARAVTVTTGTVIGLGTVLENGHGDVLYIYTPDGTKGVTCTGGCASEWPALTVPQGQTPAAGGGARAELVGTTASPGGATVVTYAGRPLYTYAGDASAGVANGQGAGGVWYVVAPSGTYRDSS